MQGRAALTHTEPFDLRVLSACANRELPELPQQFTRRIAKLQLGGQRSVLPLPSCDIKREAPAERRDGAFPAEQVQLRPSLAGACRLHAPRRCQRRVLGFGDREEGVNGGADGWEGAKGGRAEVI